MNEQEIIILKKAVVTGRVIWNPDSQTAYPVVSINKHAEEGDGLCAIFANGKYATLYNCDLNEFKIITDPSTE